MIISTYQGVGKSTLAKTNLRYIDFESSCFDKSDENWYLDYCRCALNLEKQGYIVFIASHKSVRDYMTRFGLDYHMIMFDRSIKEDVIKRLEERFKITDSDKDFRAWQNASLHFDEHYKELYNESIKNGGKLDVYFIDKMDYNLNDIVERMFIKGVTDDASCRG